MVALFQDLHRLALTAAASAGTGTEATLTLRWRGTSAVVGQTSIAAGQVTGVCALYGEGAPGAALDGRVGVSVPDLSRVRACWPMWAEEALSLGFAAALAVPSALDDDADVALTLYARHPRQWGSMAQLAAGHWADAAAERVAAFSAGDGGRSYFGRVGLPDSSAGAMDRGLAAVMAATGETPSEALDTIFRSLGGRTEELVDVGMSARGQDTRGRAEDRRREAQRPEGAVHPLRRPASG